LVWVDDGMVRVRYFEVSFFGESKLNELKGALVHEFRFVDVDQVTPKLG
jgi:hypothetical protein